MTKLNLAKYTHLRVVCLRLEGSLTDSNSVCLSVSLSVGVCSLIRAARLRRTEEEQTAISTADVSEVID